MAFKRILCAVDFSDSSLAAFRQAVELARLGASQLYVLHTIEAQPFVLDLLGLDEMGEMALKLEERAKAALESLLASSASALNGIQLTPGRAFVEVLVRICLTQ